MGGNVDVGVAKFHKFGLDRVRIGSTAGARKGKGKIADCERCDE